jgi:hypothetical protein
MKRVRKRAGKMKVAELYDKLSHETFWILIAFLSLISYITEARPFISSSFGTYSIGLLDGILTAVIVASIVFYLKSKTNR